MLMKSRVVCGGLVFFWLLDSEIPPFSGGLSFLQVTCACFPMIISVFMRVDIVYR